MDQWLKWSFSSQTQEMITLVFFWVGYAFIIGQIVHWILPGKSKRTPYMVFLIGLTGCCLGPLLISHFQHVEQFTPVSPAGLIASLLTAFSLSILYYLFVPLFSRKKKESDDSSD